MKKTVGKPKMCKQTLFTIIVAIAFLLYLFMSRMEMFTSPTTKSLYRKYPETLLNFRGRTLGGYDDSEMAGRKCYYDKRCDGIIHDNKKNKYILKSGFQANDTIPEPRHKYHLDSYLKVYDRPRRHRFPNINRKGEELN